MKVLKLVIFCLAMTSVSKAFAWGDIGHGAVGAIAEKNLTPRAKAFVYSIMGIESLAIAAVWPDQARSDERFDAFAAFHFFVIPPQFTFATLPASGRAARDSDTIISQAPRLLTQANLSREQKMILFRYLVHVVGDVHQPLHIGNGFDRGGNLCSVKWKNPTTGIIEDTNLHTVWDEKIIENIAYEFRKTITLAVGEKRWFGYKEFGDMILSDPQDFATVSSVKVSDWYDESQRLHKEVYPDGGVSVKPSDRAYCKAQDEKTDGKFDVSKIPTLDSAYVQGSIAIVKKRVLFAGYRLAGIINKMAESVTLKGRTLTDDMRVLEAITLKNQ